jgi:flagellar biosynthesis/type III secretory pathway M-ring protein FliF/YscJ
MEIPIPTQDLSFTPSPTFSETKEQTEEDLHLSPQTKIILFSLGGTVLVLLLSTILIFVFIRKFKTGEKKKTSDLLPSVRNIFQ